MDTCVHCGKVKKVADLCCPRKRLQDYSDSELPPKKRRKFIQERGRSSQPGRRAPSPSPARHWRPWEDQVGGGFKYHSESSCYGGIHRQVKYMHRGSCDIYTFLKNVNPTIEKEVSKHYKQHGATKFAVAINMGFANDDSGIYAYIR